MGTSISPVTFETALSNSALKSRYIYQTYDTAQKFFEAIQSGHIKLLGRARFRFYDEKKRQFFVIKSRDLHAYLEAKVFPLIKTAERVRQATVRALDRKPANTVLGTLASQSGALIDATSVIRNAAGGSSAPAAVATGATMGLIGGPLMTTVAAPRIIEAGGREAVSGIMHRDAEGTTSGMSTGVGGVAYMGVGAALTVKSAATAAGLAGIASASGIAAGASFALPIIGLVMYAAFLVKAIVNLATASSFRSAFKEAETLGPERAIQFLKEQVILSANDYQEIRKLPVDQQNAETKRLLQKKYARFSKNTNEELLRKVLSDEFIELDRELQQGAKDPVQRHLLMNAAYDLLDGVNKASYKSATNSKILLGICIVGLAGMVTSFCAGPAAPIAFAVLFAATSLLWLAIDYSKLNDKIIDHLYAKEAEKRTARRVPLAGFQECPKGVAAIQKECPNIEAQLNIDLPRLHCSVAGVPTENYARFLEVLTALHGNPLRAELRDQIAACAQQGAFAAAWKAAIEQYQPLMPAGGRGTIKVEKYINQYRISLESPYSLLDPFDGSVKGQIKVDIEIFITPSTDGSADLNPQYFFSIKKL